MQGKLVLLCNRGVRPCKTMPISELPAPKRTPWNKGKLTGAKAPLRQKHVWAIRTKLQTEQRTRDLALFNLAIDSKLRGCDVVAIKVEDVAPRHQSTRLPWYRTLGRIPGSCVCQREMTYVARAKRTKKHKKIIKVTNDSGAEVFRVVVSLEKASNKCSPPDGGPRH